MKKVCIYHIAEIYLYEYYLQPGEYEVVEPDPLNELLEKGAAEEKRGGYVAAVQDYEKALDWNPVRTETFFHLIGNLYRIRRLDEMHAYTEKVFPFVCTKAELAQYYRWTGCWYLETYQPEISECVYRYSTLFEKSRQAEEEIHYLETALGRKMPSYSVKELQDKLMDNHIPVHASNVTAALLLKAGEEAEEHLKDFLTNSESGLQNENNREEKTGTAAQKNVWRQQALDCYRMAYDLTEDAEIEARIKQMPGLEGI